MQHAAACDDCAIFWTELQAAQQLTLQLRRPHVGADFRESLWQRIQAGEGTPDAVFRERVPLVAKLRYALTGAAAAAAALLCALSLAPDDERPVTQPIAAVDGGARGAPALLPAGGGSGSGTRVWHQDPPSLDGTPLMAATQRLGVSLVAVEAARQLEQRYNGTTMGLHRLASGGDVATDRVVHDVLDNAEELHQFGDLLLELCDRQRLVFTDEKLESDLRFAVTMLAQTESAERDLRTVKAFVEPALGSSRLASVSHKIMLPPLEPGEEQDLVARMNLEWPEIFAKLFVVAGNGEPAGYRYGWVPIDGPFLQGGTCDPILVAPRSLLERYTHRSMLPGSPPPGQRVQFHIQVREKK